MRVGLVVLEDFPGSETRVQRQARSLIGAGVDVRVYAARGRSEERRWNGVEIERSWVGRRKAGSLKRRAWEYAAFPVAAFLWCLRNAVTWKPNVVQIANMPDWLVFSALPARFLNGTRVILDLHDPMPELMTAKGGARAVARMLKAIEGASARFADAVLVPTRAMARVIEERHEGVRPVVIPNAVDTSVFALRRRPIVRQERKCRTIGYHGTLSSRFGLHVAIEALRLLRERGWNAKLVVCGWGDAGEELQNLAARMDVKEYVEFLGQVASEELPAIIDRFDVGLVPYEDSAFMRLAYSTKAFEYAARGVPVVASDLPSLREQLRDGAEFFEAGSVKALADAVERVLRDPQRAEMLAVAASAVVRQYVWEQWEGKYLDIVLRGAS